MAEVREELTAQVSGPTAILYVPAWAAQRTFKAWKPSTCMDSCSWVNFEIMGKKAEQRLKASFLLHVQIFITEQAVL